VGGEDGAGGGTGELRLGELPVRTVSARTVSFDSQGPQVAAVSPTWVYRESRMKQLYDRRCGVRDWLHGARSAVLVFDEINMSWHNPPEPNSLPWCGETQRLVSPEPEFRKVFSGDCPEGGSMGSRR
jgi:hypothetical protein